MHRWAAKRGIVNKRKDLSCGIPGLDAALGGIWAGDNVVLQVDSIDDFVPFAHAFCRYARDAGRHLVYFRFADHRSFVPEDVVAETHVIDPTLGFEQFISEILTVIEKCGKDAVYYVFDSLSGLAVDWYSDRMLGNFFKLTCPYLYIYDTVAAFVLLRDVHTPLAEKAIHRTAQVVLDVFNHDGRLYILPLKVFERTSPTMYMLHSVDDGKIEPVRRSIVLSEILSNTQQWVDVSIQRRSPWDETLIEAARALECPDDDCDVAGLTARLVKMIMSRDETDEVFRLCSEYLTLPDLVEVGKRMVGTGLIGGKSVGMLLARKILAKNRPDLAEQLEIHDSFYVGSDAYYSFLIDNDCWWDRHNLRNADDLFERARIIEHRMRSGLFPTKIVEQFVEILDYFGQSPLIVRSSSLLEDAYGNSFSGKYESVFCANQGGPEQRLHNFEEAVRTIYASTMSEQALSYRIHRGLFHRDEQMALLVQRVSGEFHEPLYFPQAAGVGYSYNPYAWNDRIDPADGMLRLVFGLGTRAVDRHDDDYTRVVALSEPRLRPEGSSDEVYKYSQRIVNVLDLDENAHVSRTFEDVVKTAPNVPIEQFAARDTAMEARAREHGMKGVFSWVLTFDHLLTKTRFADQMREMMQTIADAYQHAVDIEFTVNFLNRDDYRINLLQCRPFHFLGELTHVKFPESVPEERIVLQSAGPLIGQSLATPVDRIIYVVPELYGALPVAERHAVARLIGRVANHASSPAVVMLAGPGRWGTSMPELGIPVVLSEIKNAKVLVEVARMHEGLNPDLSLGTHFFNDLVDLGILYIGVAPERQGHVLNQGLVLDLRNRLVDLVPEAGAYEDMVHVIDAADCEAGEIWLRADAIEQKGIVFTSASCPIR